jgi:hypothetical protein
LLVVGARTDATVELLFDPVAGVVEIGTVLVVGAVLVVVVVLVVGVG